jgi:hypothetical protein
VPAFTVDATRGQALTQLGKTFLDGLRQHAQDNYVKLPGLPDDPKTEIPPDQIVTVLGRALATYFPSLAPTSTRDTPS